MKRYQLTHKEKLNLGLYFHIPFCAQICHYCDFAKTALWDQEKLNTYITRLEAELKLWLDFIEQNYDLNLLSVNFGGGTPSLFSGQYKGIFDLLGRRLRNDTEISLETNPNDLSEEKLKVWRQLGFNRISIGVQTFDQNGLEFLKRDHSQKEAKEKIELTHNFFENINLDLIYGWKHQTLDSWKRDLALSIDLKTNHVSLYNLTYAAQTPIGRAYQRGKLKEMSEDLQIDMYQYAKNFLAENGFDHVEVSNWAKKGYYCQHNELYWSDGYYLGLGTGAHSYLPIMGEKEVSNIGMRFSYDKNLKTFLEKKPQDISQEVIKTELNFEVRNKESWLMEYIGCSLRYYKGISLSHIKNKVQKDFKPTPTINHAIASRLINLEGDQLTITEVEWIRETLWADKILECF